MKVQDIKQDFPILQRKIRDQPIIYLDNAATSQKPIQVIESISTFYKKYYSNVHRGGYSLSQRATESYEAAHEKLANFVNAKDRREIIFTKNITEAINLIAYSLLMNDYFKEGGEIVITEFEHHSNLVPWQFICQRTDATLKTIATNSDGTVDMEDAKGTITKQTKLVSLVHLSNFLGTILPIKKLIKIAHEVNALCFIDSAQGVPHLPIDVKEIGCDFLGFTGHKMLGPTGIGGVYVKEELAKDLHPFLGGGEMISEVWYDHASWNRLPYKFEAGTPPIAQAVGLTAAVEYLQNISMKEIREHEEALVSEMLEKMKELEGIEIYGPLSPSQRGGLVSFNIKGMHPHDVASLLDERKNIMVRSGHHCVMPMHRKLGLNGSVRASFQCYNSTNEVKELIKTLKQIKKLA